MAQDLARQHLLEEIASVEGHLAVGDIHIDEQRRRIDWQERTGRSSALSRELLATYLVVRASHLSHQDRLICQLRGARARVDPGAKVTAGRPEHQTAGRLNVR